MNASIHFSPPGGIRHTRGPLGGIMLIVIGFIALLTQLLPNEWMAYWFLPVLGLVFLIWGLLAREVGPLVPGGILTGIGGGAILVQALQRSYGEPATGGIFMFTFAAGWVLITLASWLIHRTVLWPLVVAAIMAFVGAALMIGGPALTVLDALGRLWPLALIGLGAWIVFRRSGWRQS